MTVIVRAFRRHPRWYAAGLVVVLLVVAVAVWLAVRTPAGEPELATARTGPLDRTVALTGTVEPRQRADLDFPAGGEVVSVPVAVGQQVAAGQELASVDAASLSGQVAQARSALASAEARLAADRSADASSAQIEADRAAVDSAQAQLDVARRNEANATLTAPFAGTVAAVNVTVGEQVAAGGAAASGGSSGGSGNGSGSGAGAAGSGGGPSAPGGGASATAAASAASSGGAAVVVVSTGAYVIDATVDDTQVGQLRAGQRANITPNGAVDPIPGTVESVALVATSTSGVAGYPVTIAVSGSPAGLYIGSSAQVEVVTEQITDAVLVPSAAVSGSGAEAAVTVLEQGEQVRRPVTVGVTSGGRTQIVQGLSSGEQVVLPEAAAVPQPAGFGGGFGGNRQGGQNGPGQNSQNGPGQNSQNGPGQNSQDGPGQDEQNGGEQDGGPQQDGQPGGGS